MNHNERCNCKKLERLVYGDRPDQSDGIASIVVAQGKTLHGTPEEPGGLIKRVEKMEEKQAFQTKLIFIGTGMALAAKIAWEIYTHLVK